MRVTGAGGAGVVGLAAGGGAVEVVTLLRVVGDGRAEGVGRANGVDAGVDDGEGVPGPSLGAEADQVRAVRVGRAGAVAVRADDVRRARRTGLPPGRRRDDRVVQQHAL